MRVLLLLLVSCSDSHIPAIYGALDGNECGRVAVAEYTAENSCIKLDNIRETLFKLKSSESCGGPPCLVIQLGDTAYALEKSTSFKPAEWSVSEVDCSEQCCADYLGKFQCWR